MKPDEWKIFAYGMENNNMPYIFLKLFVGNSNKLALVKILWVYSVLLTFTNKKFEAN